MSTEHTRVLAALDSVPRVGFLPPELRALAGVDRPLPIGYGATNSQPWTVRFMLELLAVPAGGKLLDVGSGSGWTTALLAHLTGPEGSVLGVDIVPELVAWGGENLRSTGLFWA
ncbi:MAG: class I SAM-dependent methyltransferase, partial [Propionicimonas sp.]